MIRKRHPHTSFWRRLPGSAGGIGCPLASSAIGPDSYGILEKVLVDGGFMTAADMHYHFFVTDHLGNVRVVVNDAGVVEQVNQFYPYGEATDMGQGVLDSIDNPYKWSGKEWDEDQGAYDFGARMYSAADARWTTMDPLSEKYYHISPYAYCAGNPVNWVDPDGRDIYLFDEQGNYLRKVEQKGRNRAAIRSEDKDGNVHISYYDFADPKNDAKDIDDGIINEIVFVSAEKIDGYLKGSGTYGDNVFGITDPYKANGYKHQWIL